MAITVTRFAYMPGGEAMVNFDATVTAGGGDVVLARSYWGRRRWQPIPRRPA